MLGSRAGGQGRGWPPVHRAGEWGERSGGRGSRRKGLERERLGSEVWEQEEKIQCFQQDFKKRRKTSTYSQKSKRLNKKKNDRVRLGPCGDPQSQGHGNINTIF